MSSQIRCVAPRGRFNGINRRPPEYSIKFQVFQFSEHRQGASLIGDNFSHKITQNLLELLLKGNFFFSLALNFTTDRDDGFRQTDRLKLIWMERTFVLTSHVLLVKCK